MLRRPAAGLSPLSPVLLGALLALCGAQGCGASNPAATIEEARRLRDGGRPADAAALLADLAMPLSAKARRVAEYGEAAGITWPVLAG